MIPALALALGLGLAGTTASAAPEPAELTFAEIERIALAEIPGGVVEDIERETERGRIVFEVEVRDPDGFEYELIIDAHDGEVLAQKSDD